MREEHKKLIEELFEKHSNRLYAYMLGVLSDPEEARDIVAETFLRASRELELIEPGANARSWLFTVATNLARNHLTRFVRRILRVSSQFFDMFSDGRDKTFESASQNFEYKKLAGLIEKFDRRERELIYLRFYEDMTYNEIALITKMPEGTVSTLIRRALGRLENELQR